MVVLYCSPLMDYNDLELAKQQRRLCLGLVIWWQQRVHLLRLCTAHKDDYLHLLVVLLASGSSGNKDWLAQVTKKSMELLWAKPCLWHRDIRIRIQSSDLGKKTEL